MEAISDYDRWEDMLENQPKTYHPGNPDRETGARWNWQACDNEPRPARKTMSNTIDRLAYEQRFHHHH